MKIARIVPLFKSGDPSLFNNYRPVSVLPIFSKILEKIVYNRLVKYLDKYKVLNIFQFGFRKNHSASMALIYICDKIVKAIENGEYVIGLFLDFSKAFDTVNLNILLDKLCFYGIRGNMLNWFRSYLMGREQFVRYNEHESARKQVTCGVPQGSKLGPISFFLSI